MPPVVPFTGNPELKARLDAPGNLSIAGQRGHAELLRRFYAEHGYQIVWDSHPAQVASLINTVLQAETQGLDPAEYHGAMLSRVASLAPVDRDLLLSDAFLGYADALARGAMPIEARDDDEDLTPGPVDVVAAIDGAINAGDAGQAIVALAPNSPDYLALRRAYAAYRHAVDAGGFPKVQANNVAGVQQRLVAEAYLPAGAVTGTFDAATSQALRAYQAHHALEADGRLDGETIAELNVPADIRMRQVAINLERVRWLPRSIPADRVWVNIVTQHLQLFENDRQVFATRVVVGADDKQTPEFATTIHSVLFNPPWNVPRSIIAKEILPKLGAGSDYLARHHMIMRANGTVQQEAGPHSALGQLKFEMDDRYDVYLHDTPEKSFFRRGERRLSHGCVRVENPRVMASILLQENEEAINKAVGVGTTHRRSLGAPIAVFLVYQTAYADPDGSIEFRHDGYERDDEIWQALNRSQAIPVAQARAPVPTSGKGDGSQGLLN